MARPKKIIYSSEEKTTAFDQSSPVEESVKKDEKTEDLYQEIKITNLKTNKVESIKVSDVPSREMAKEKLKKLIEQETKLVRGRFRNFETPGGSLRVQIRKYPNIPPFDKVMLDNEMYEIPLYVARHLNGVDVVADNCGGKIHSCSWPTHGFKWDPGKPMPGCDPESSKGIPVPIVGVEKWNRRFGFESLEFDTQA